ncbi:hypothetical protein UPYG_G00324140 [Umbra pygmaea]|uniref:Cilia- and flagella-associated protein 43 n=1 Tax=Umbra pygmaea TaxID=75934 RepID=A0ABD0W5M8_UMBPY
MDLLANVEFRWTQGLTSQHFEFVDNRTVCYTCGNYLVFLNIENNIRSVLQSPGGGVGSFTANGHSNTLAFSDQKLNPSIFVFKYPELTLKNDLKGTAQLEYTSLALSDTGPYVASCSSQPDQLISVWNWETGTQICNQPLAGKDITSLIFNPLNWLQICGLSASSLTIWNIEKSESFHKMKPSVIDLSVKDGCLVKEEMKGSHVSTGKLTYLGPQIPTSAVTGLLQAFLPNDHMETRLKPSAICWTSSSGLYVGCHDGHLLQVGPEFLSVSVLCSPSDDFHQGSFQSLALHKNGLFFAGKENVLRCLQIKGNQVEVTQTWKLEEPATSIIYSPDYAILLLASSTGRIYNYIPSQGQEVVKLLDILRGDFVAAASLYTDTNVCVSVRESGDMQLWSLDSGTCVGSISLQVKVTSLACCPIAQYVAVGTVSGHVLFVELTRKQQPRLVHKVKLYYTPVDHILFDQGGNFLITSSSDQNIFLLNARPSRAFAVMGYTGAEGAIVSLSAQYSQDTKQVKLLVLCDEQKESGHREGTVLTLLTLHVQELTGAGVCADPRGRLSSDVLHKRTYKVAQALSSSALGHNMIFGYCYKRKYLQRFQLPESKESSFDQEVVPLTPAEEVKSHLMGPASVLLSPHQLWLASVGKDGLLCIREISSMSRFLQIQCHSCWLGGVRTVSFNPDSKTILTTGLKDGSLVCTRLRMEIDGSSKVNASTEYSQSVASAQDSELTENPILRSMADWESEAVSPPDQQRAETSERQMVDLREQDQSESLQSTSDSTWLDNKMEAVIKEESQQFSQTRKSLRKDMKHLRDTIQAMIRENETLPEMEKLEVQEFNLDVEEQKRLQAVGVQEVTRVQNEIELKILAKCYLRDVLKREWWDSMKVKGKAIKSFHSEYEVMNYPLKEQTQQELNELHRVESMRKIERIDSLLQQEILENKSRTDLEEEEGEGCEMEGAALTGSLSGQYGGSNTFLYNQFTLHTREQKINQITLLQDVIYKVKTAFNRDFDGVYKHKEQAINRVKDRNRRIVEIMSELDLKMELWEPSLSDNERPERALSVEDSEIQVERYLTPEQIQKGEERKTEEEQRKLAAKSDNIRERALDEMMGGVLEWKKEDILRMEVPHPEFIVSKPESQWTEEEKKIHNDYEKKIKELSEQKENFRKNLEAEIKKLQTSIMDATQSFDEVLTKLFEKKVKSEMVINQEELKIANLVYSILIEEEVINNERQLSLKLEDRKLYKNKTGEELNQHKQNVEMFRETYDNVVAEDKLLDKGFRKEFFDVPGHIVDQLYKLYKRRPRVQRMRTQTDNTSPFKERPLLGPVAADGLSQMMKAMEELDARENMPEGLDPSVWERFCLTRRIKVESEHQVKVKALSLAEMQAFLQKMTDEDESARLEIKNVIDDINRLREEKMHFHSDIMVQIVLKQGQVEVEHEDFVADYSDAILLHRSVVEDLNKTIRALGEQKIATMVVRKDFRKGIIQQEWEHKRMRMQMEDLNNKSKDIKKLHVTRELREYLHETDHEKRTSEQFSTLEKTIALQEKTHQKKVKHCKEMLEQLNKQAKMRAKKNIAMDEQLAHMNVTVAERRHIYEAIAMEKNHESDAEERYQEIIQKKKLVELAKAQAEEVAFLRVAVERLRLKNFPAFAPL